jgi:hypothetical protein
MLGRYDSGLELCLAINEIWGKMACQSSDRQNIGWLLTF